jgi:hypothetical protein
VSGRGLAIAGAVTAAVVAVAAALVLLLGGGPQVADCYSAAGATPEGEKFQATLRLTLDGDLVSGVYTAGERSGQGVALTVTGTLDGDRFDGTFAAAGVSTHATGTITRDHAEFDTGPRTDKQPHMIFRPDC